MDRTMICQSSVSIIIPCYNDGQYLPEAIAAAQSQTYSATEILVVDDHSTDSHTLAVYDDLRRQGIQVLQTPPGKRGPAAARNAGIAAAKGSYILPLDADDSIDATYIAKAVAILEGNPSIGICYCRAKFFGLKSGRWNLPPYTFENLLCGNIIFASALFRKADWVKVGGYDESLTLGLEDYAFWLRLTAAGTGVHRLEEELFSYRIKGKSRTAQMVAQNGHTQALDMVYASCADIFARHADILLRKISRLQCAEAQRTCLYSWRLISPLFRLEWFVRQIIKRIVGRA